MIELAEAKMKCGRQEENEGMNEMGEATDEMVYPDSALSVYVVRPNTCFVDPE